MENDGETADDQNSGWFEVKKKHKTSPKLFVQKPTARSFNKDQTFTPCYQASTNSETGNANYREIFASTKVQLSNASSSKVDVTRDALLPVKRNNEQGLEPQISKPADPNGEAKVIEEVARWDNIPKIKWGNLDDSVFTLHEHSQTPLCFPKAENLGCGVVSTDNFKEHGNADNLPESQSLILSNSQDTCETILRTLESVKESPATSLPSDMLVQSIDMNCEKVKEQSSKDVKASSADGNGGYDSLKANHNGSRVSEVGRLLRCNNTDGENWPTPMSPVLGIVQKKVVVDLHPEIESGVMNSSNLSKNDTNTRTFDLREGIHQNVHAGPETSARTSVIAAMEGQKFLQDCSTVGTDLGDNESGESKERFRQRLWCFLFESLNRAVDELYLLCELECDVEQMDEATLVLEEAISDFKDLKCRVGHFENTKRSSCQPREGMPITVKSDHRRPHALSWEVRRMTTSSQRAEILSSSLEAFKKIQMERAGKDMNKDDRKTGVTSSNPQDSGGSSEANKVTSNSTEMQANSVGNNIMVKQNTAAPRLGRSYFMQSGCVPSQNLPSADAGKCTREPLEPICETHKQLLRKDKESSENRTEKHPKSVDTDKKQNSYIEKNKEKQNMKLWKSMDAWKEKRNWEDILKSPLRSSSRVSYSPGMNRKGVDRARVLHDKLMTPEKRKKNAADLKREAEEKHARAMRIRNQLEIERLQRLQRTSEKLNRVSEWQAVRSTKLREIMFARHQRSESLHEAYLAGVVRRAGDESSKVNEVRFITSLNEENKKLMIRQKLHDSEVRRAEKLQVIKIKLKGDIAREEAVLERKKLLEAEKLQRLAETQRKKEEAQVRREEERKASSAAREARAVEQLRRKEIRAKVQQEEAEMLAQRLAERLRESEQRRKYYLEQIREKASMDFRDQSSPLQRRCINKEAQNGRSMPVNSSENSAAACNSDSDVKLIDGTNQQSIKRRIKRIRQRLMALKHDFIEYSVTTENSGVGSKASVGAARVKIGRWIQELQRLRQASKERATSIGLIVGDIIKFLEGKDVELHASRQAGLLDFIASALPASHTTKPEACQVTLYLLRLLRIVLSLPANRSYFLVQNLLPPIIPMLSTSLENYIKVAASSNSGSTNLLSSKTSCENLESVTEVLDGFLWIVSIIIGHVHFDDRQVQMQDDLMELIITYQVIHRLRDLFALYDRPLVEGSPFPSSILSSLTLLLVLTSRPGTISSIDWDSCVAKTEMINKVGRPELYDCQDKEEISVVINHSGEGKTTLTSNEFLESYSDESAPPSGKEKSLSSEELLSDNLEGKNLEEENEKEIPGLSIGLAEIETVTERQVKSSSQEQKDVFEGQAKSITTQKDEKISKNGPAERTRHDAHISYNNNGRKSGILKQHIICLISSISETGLVSLLSLLTAVLLQANNKLSSEQASYILPSNFEEVATGVLKVLNNLANLDITILQSMLDRPDLKVEFVHLTSFLLTHCSNKWKNANDQVGLLLQESLVLLGYFALFHPENQAALRWGKSPTILHKVCDLPFVFFSDPELMPILAGTLVAACYGCEQNKAVVQQELSTEMLLSLLKSCKQGLSFVHVDSLVPDSSIAIDPSEGTQVTKDSKKPHSDVHVRSNRRTARVLLGKGTPFSSVRNNKTKIQRDCKETKTYEPWIPKHNLPESEASSIFMLHHRFPKSFLDKAEVFFSAGVSNEQV